jgi:hypothetical protein
LTEEFEFKIHVEKKYKLIVDRTHKEVFHLLIESTKEHGLETSIKYFEINLNKMPRILSSRQSLDETIKPKMTINFEVLTKQNDILLENSTIIFNSSTHDNEKARDANLIIFFNSMLTYVNLSSGKIVFRKGKKFIYGNH